MSVCSTFAKSLNSTFLHFSKYLKRKVLEINFDFYHSTVSNKNFRVSNIYDKITLFHEYHLVHRLYDTLNESSLTGETIPHHITLKFKIFPKNKN